jgi:transcriptional regulator with XRE-family HTH domain
MAMRREAPEPWVSAMIQAGATDPRNKNRPSMRALAERAGVDTATVTGLVFGDRETELQVIEQVATALGVDVALVTEWAGRSRSVTEPYAPPKEADLLNRRQRKALDELIRAFTEPEVLSERQADATVPKKKTADDPRLSGQTPKARRRMTPLEGSFEDTHGLAARFDMDRRDE